MSIVNIDFDTAVYVGDTDDGVYVDWEKSNNGWYIGAIVDCDTASFVDTLVSDDGPYESELAAAIAAIGAAMDWCCENEVETADFIHCLPERLRDQYESFNKEDEDGTKR